jgi:DnaJ-domain-containing protein 1
VVLGTKPDASFETAKRAYKLKMKHYHPDTFAGLAPEFLKLGEQRSRELNAAIEEAELSRRKR